MQTIGARVMRVPNTRPTKFGKKAREAKEAIKRLADNEKDGGHNFCEQSSTQL